MDRFVKSVGLLLAGVVLLVCLCGAKPYSRTSARKIPPPRVTAADRTAVADLMKIGCTVERNTAWPHEPKILGTKVEFRNGGDEDFAKLANIDSLRFLSVEPGNKLTPDCQYVIPRLNHLVRLSFGNIPDLHLTITFDQLKELRVLLLEGSVSGETVRSIGSLPKLRILDMGHCKFPEGENLFKMAARISTLDCIYCMFKPEITAEDLRYLEQDKLPNLAAIYLSGTSVGDEGLKLLTQIPTLQMIRVAGAGITDAGLVGFSEKLPNLHSIDLSGNPGITDAGVEYLLGHPKLRSIDVTNTAVTEQGGTRSASRNVIKIR